MMALFLCDVVGGFIALTAGASTWNEAWGFETTHTVPLPVGAAQLLLTWLAARSARPPIGRIAAILLAVFCLISILAGLFDGDLIDNIRSDGWITPGVLWVAVLLPLTGVVGLLAAVRAGQLREPRARGRGRSWRAWRPRQ